MASSGFLLLNVLAIIISQNIFYIAQIQVHPGSHRTIHKYVDVMDLNKNYVFCIFMNINENYENQDLQRDNLLPFEGFMVGYL